MSSLIFSHWFSFGLSRLFASFSLYPLFILLYYLFLYLPDYLTINLFWSLSLLASLSLFWSLSGSQTCKPGRPEELYLLAEGECGCHSDSSAGLGYVQSAAQTTVILGQTNFKTQCTSSHDPTHVQKINDILNMVNRGGTIYRIAGRNKLIAI